MRRIVPGFNARATRCLLTAVVCLAAGRSAFAQSYLGPGKCTSAGCHELEKTWFNEKDGTKPHKDALKQLNQAEAKDYAAKMGLSGPRDPKCVECHAQPIGTRRPAGVGVACETCHGPGSDYLDPHDDKTPAARPLSISKGLLDVFADVNKWAPGCVNCHVMNDAALLAAGHSTWTPQTALGEKYKTVVQHWQKTKYGDAQVTSTGAGLARKRAVAAGPPGPTAAAPAPAAPPAAPAPAPAPPPAAAPAAPATPPAGAPAPAPAPPATAPAPPAAPSPGPAAGPRPAPAPARVAPSPVVPAAAAPPPPEAAMPRTAVSITAERQAALIAALDKLLRRTPPATLTVKPPDRSMGYQGADAELLRLQRDVLALALEALATAPPAPPKK